MYLEAFKQHYFSHKFCIERFQKNFWKKLKITQVNTILYIVVMNISTILININH